MDVSVRKILEGKSPAGGKLCNRCRRGVEYGQEHITLGRCDPVPEVNCFSIFFISNPADPIAAPEPGGAKGILQERSIYGLSIFLEPFSHFLQRTDGVFGHGTIGSGPDIQQQIAAVHLTHLKTLLDNASKGRYGRDKAVEIREAARRSIGSKMPAKSLELRHTIQLILELDKEIDEVEAAIAEIMYSIQSPITTIPGMGLRMGAMILAEVGDFANFDSPDKILAYAGLSPSTYESGKLSLTGAYSHMEKRGSRYLRYAIFNATKYVCIWDPTFAAYLAKKRAEGKHYNVAISHAAKKLVRVIYALQKSGKAYRTAT